jgi:chromosome segregation ATPase
VTNALDERSALADSQKGEIASLTIQVRTLKEQLSQAREGTTAAEDHRDTTLRALSEKGSELAMLTNVLEERSVRLEAAKAAAPFFSSKTQFSRSEPEPGCRGAVAREDLSRRRVCCSWRGSDPR